MRVIVVGAGVIGTTTAHYLSDAGCEVVVLERRPGVAQECSFANAGLIAPGYVGPWAAPGMPRKILGTLLQADAPVRFRPRFDSTQWRWIARWLGECRLERYKVNRERMQRVAIYSRSLLQELRERFELDYEQGQGYLQLLRSAHDVELAEPGLALLSEKGISYQRLSPAECREREPGLSDIELAAGIYRPADESGNCALFTRQIKDIAARAGAQFEFDVAVASIDSDAHGVSVHASRAYSADAVVVAAGVDSRLLLAPLGLSVPLYAVKGYSATMPIKEPSRAPRAAIMDEAYKVALTRLGNRLRVAGTAEIGGAPGRISDRAVGTLIRVARDWFPGCADFNRATYWSGARPMLPDGPPLLGASGVDRVFLNLGHGSTGWTMACASARIITDVVLGRAPEIDLEGLTIARYARR